MTTTLQLIGCAVELAAGVVTRSDGSTESLTARERTLLAYLAERPARDVGRDELLTEVWGYSDQVVSRAIDSTVRRLREKIETDPALPRHLLTAWGTGYRFEPLRAEPSRSPPPPPARARRIGDRMVDLDLGLVRTPGGDTPLTTAERAVLERLVDARGAVVETARLAREVCGRGPRAEGALYSIVHRLRRKIEPNPDVPRYLLTVRRHGVRLAAEEPPASHAVPTLVRVEAPAERQERLNEGVRAAGGAAVGDGCFAFAVHEAALAWVDQVRELGLTIVVTRGSVAWRADPAVPNAPPRTRWVGRERESAELRSLVAAGRWVVIVGPGGVGKTRLAREVLGEAVWVDLVAAHTPSELRAAVAVALGLEPTADPVAGLVRRGPVRVVLDNLESVEPEAVAAAVRGWLAAAPEARWVATSRVRPGLDGERVLELQGLPVNAARELFLDRATPTPADSEGVERLVERLDGLPLAIELAAARVPTLAPAEILRRLERQLDLLARGAADEVRHRSLRAALAGSLEALTPDARAALASLSLFDQGFDADDAEGLLDAADGAGPCGLDLLQTLRDHSLVRTRAGEARPFRLYEGIRLLVSEWAAANPDGSREVTLRWCRFLARLGEPSHLARLFHRGEEERGRHQRQRVEDLERASGRALGWGEVELAATLALGAAAVRQVHGPSDGSVRALRAVLDARALGEPHRSRVQIALAELLLRAHRPREARGAAASATHPETLGDALRLVGATLAEEGRNAESCEVLPQAVVRLRATHPDRAAVAEAELELARVRVARGDGERCLAAYERAAREAARSGNLRLHLAILDILARFDLVNGRPSQGVQRLVEAAELAQQLSLPNLELSLSESLLDGCRLTGDRVRLELVGQRVLALAARTGVEVSWLWALLAEARASWGDRAGAWEAIRLVRASGGADRELVCARSERAEARLWVDEGDLGSAAAAARSSIERFRQIGDWGNVARSECVLAWIRALGGEEREALAVLDGLIERAGQRADWSPLLMRAVRGRVRWMAGDRDGARADLSEAERGARRDGYDLPGGEVALALAALREVCGDATA